MRDGRVATQGCPCGRRLDPRGGCPCAPHQVAHYLGRISGPLLDRIDLHVEMAAVSFSEMSCAASVADDCRSRGERADRRGARGRGDRVSGAGSGEGGHEGGLLARRAAAVSEGALHEDRNTMPRSPSLRIRVSGTDRRRHLPALREALQRELKIAESTRSQERAA